MPSKPTKPGDLWTCPIYLCRRVSWRRNVLTWLSYCAYSCVCAHACTPLGCPALQGSEGSQQNLMGVLETALKLTNQDADTDDEEAGAKVEALQML